MAAAALRAQLNAHLASMYAEGVVNEETFRDLQEDGSAVEVASSFLDDAQMIIDDIDDLMDEPVVAFEDVKDLVLQLMGCTSSVGAKQMKLACMHFGSFYAMESNEGCLVSLALVRNEFCLLRNNLETMMKRACLPDLETMAAAAIRAQSNVLIGTMYARGTVDDNFLQLQTMREQGSVTPGYVVEVLNRFINDADRIITDISGMLKQPEVDLDMVDALVDELKASSSSVGAKGLHLICIQHFFPEAKTKEGYHNALGHARFQFGDVRSMFRIMIELEQHIVTCGPK